MRVCSARMNAKKNERDENLQKVRTITIPFTEESGKQTERLQLSLTEASKFTGVPKSTLRKLGREGAFNPVTGFGRKHYILAEDLLNLLTHRLRNETHPTAGGRN